MVCLGGYFLYEGEQKKTDAGKVLAGLCGGAGLYTLIRPSKAEREWKEYLKESKGQQSAPTVGMGLSPIPSGGLLLSTQIEF